MFAASAGASGPTAFRPDGAFRPRGLGATRPVVRGPPGPFEGRANGPLRGRTATRTEVSFFSLGIEDGRLRSLRFCLCHLVSLCWKVMMNCSCLSAVQIQRQWNNRFLPRARNWSLRLSTFLNPQWLGLARRYR